MLDPTREGVSAADWAAATAGCCELRVRRVIDETADARSIVLEIPPSLAEKFRYRPGQFLSFKIPFQGKVLTRSYSLASSPDCDAEHKFTVKRIADGRVSNWINDHVGAGRRADGDAARRALRAERRRADASCSSAAGAASRR